MRLNQRQVVTIDLQDGTKHEFTLQQDSQGYRLTANSDRESVQILLSAEDLNRLRQSLRYEFTELTATIPSYTIPVSPKPEPPLQLEPRKSAKRSARPATVAYGESSTSLSSTDDWVGFN